MVVRDFWLLLNAVDVPGMGQLLVWEWQSESYVFKQQGHFNNLASLAYSPDGQYIATGGDDGKVSTKANTVRWKVDLRVECVPQGFTVQLFYLYSNMLLWC